jgi:hypothetical protein
MIQFTRPTNLNGEELRAELNAGGVVVNQPPLIDAENNLWLEIAEKDKAKAKVIVAAHNGTTVAVDNTPAKDALLAKLGITADEVKLLLQ